MDVQHAADRPIDIDQASAQRLIVGLLVLALVVADMAIADYCARLEAHRPFVALFALSQLALAGAWLTLGRANLLTRIVPLAATLVFWDWLVVSTFGAKTHFLEPMTVFTVCLVAQFGLMRLSGVRLGTTVDRRHPTTGARGLGQFTLRQLFSLTTAVAVMFATVRYLALRLDLDHFQSAECLAAVSISLLAAVAVWLECRAFYVAALHLVPLVLVFLVGWAGAMSLGHMHAAHLLPPCLLLLYFQVLHVAGYTLARAKRALSPNVSSG